MQLTLETPIIELHKQDIGKLSAAMARKLAMAVANVSNKTELTDATVEDLLNYYPKRYEDRTNFIGIDKLYDGIEATVELYVRVAGGYQVGKNRGPKQPPLFIFEISASDADRRLKPVVVWWFVSGKQAKHIIEYYSKQFPRGTRFAAFGKWEWDARRNTFGLKLLKPDELEILPSIEDDLFSNTEDQKPKTQDQAEGDEDLLEDTENPEFAMIHSGRHVPVYRKLGPFQTKRLREIIYDTLSKLDKRTVNDDLPDELRRRKNLISRWDAIDQIHFPPDGALISEYEMARSPAHLRLIFEEFFWVSLALQYQRGERQKEPKGTIVEISNEIEKRIHRFLPFQLTNAQTRVIRSIFDDMTSDSPMNRLVQGDVGSGKTIVALAAIYAAMENGYQTAMMAPTEILAEQHARNAKNLFSDTPYRVELLTGSLKAAEKRKVQKDLAAGEINAIIGTHAIIQDAVEFEKLGLAIIDEQHRFGVLQRAGLRSRGYNPDILVMTATPIPRSLAMTVYGDLDVSIIDELPPGRTPIKTVVVGEDQRNGVYKGIEREISLGRQIYVVYPLIEESEKIDL